MYKTTKKTVYFILGFYETHNVSDVDADVHCRISLHKEVKLRLARENATMSFICALYTGICTKNKEHEMRLKGLRELQDKLFSIRDYCFFSTAKVYKTHDRQTH